MTGKLIVALILVLGIAPAMADACNNSGTPCASQGACTKAAAPADAAPAAAAAPEVQPQLDRAGKLKNCPGCGKPALICKCQAAATAPEAPPAADAPAPAAPPVPEAPSDAAAPAPAAPPAPEAPPQAAAAPEAQPAAGQPKSIQTILDERSKVQPTDAGSVRGKLSPDMQKFMDKVDALRRRRAERDAQAAGAPAAPPMAPAPEAPAPK